MSKIKESWTVLVHRSFGRWTPNQITGFGIMMVLVLLMVYVRWGLLWPTFIPFVLAALTDLIDGAVARAREMVTSGGKVLDITRDQLLVWCTVGVLWWDGSIPFHRDSPVLLALVFLLFREVIVTSIRLAFNIKAEDVEVVWWGKCKTFSFMAGLGLLLLNDIWITAELLSIVFLFIAAIFSFASGVQYIVQFTPKPKS
jgi:CDP-diacylglycerol--glycerol-3-phosphate 3-phosphatidyltransferase